ncbi:hypothetical protein ACFQMM_08990 [Saliphagus sp. GCM10025308]
MTAHRIFEDEFGRIRNVVQAPDGSVLLATSNRDGMDAGSFPIDGDDRIVRLGSP